MTEAPIPAREIERRGQLETLLKRNAHRIILSYIRVQVYKELVQGYEDQSHKELSAPYVFMQHHEDDIRMYAGRLSYISSEINQNPDEVLIDTIEKVLKDMAGGEFSHGAYTQYNRKDEPAIRELLDEIKTGKRKIQPFTEKDKIEVEKAINEAMEKTVEAPSLVDKFSLDGEWQETNKWHEVKSQPDYPNIIEILVALKGGRTMTIRVSRFDLQLFPAEQDKMDDQTFPTTNAVFHYTGSRKPDSPTRKIICVEETDNLVERLGTLEKALSPRSVEEIESELRRKMARILRQSQIISYFARVFPTHINTAEIIEDLVGFLSENSSGEGLSILESMDLGFLIDQYLKVGSFPGNCVSLSTLMVGFAKVIGLKARIVEGWVQDLEDNTSASHMWAEIYIPKIKNWVPADPAFGATLIYPSAPLTYFLRGQIIKASDDDPLRIKVSYT